MQSVLPTVSLQYHLFARLYKLHIALGYIHGHVLLLSEIQLRWHRVFLLRSETPATAISRRVCEVHWRVKVISRLILIAYFDGDSLFPEILLHLLRNSFRSLHLRVNYLLERGVILDSQRLAQDIILSLVQFQCLAQIIFILIFVVRCLGHREIFGLEDNITGLSRRDDVHHDSCELLGTFKFFILVFLILNLKCVKNLLLQDFLLQLTRICLPSAQDRSSNAHSPVSNRVLEVLLQGFFEEFQRFFR